MKIYLVGGAIRDQLLGHPVKERDWVVVGGTPEALMAAGYQPIGEEFPIFLHPVTHEEYALARTERKVAKGYKGFNFYAAEDVTLEEDLKRRDLTINAIAQAEDGTLIDPYGGQEDLKNKLLRHVSPAFAEDPVRILRLARFAAKFPNFSVCTDTEQLMESMVAQGEVDALVAERVWKELVRALDEPTPMRFFEVLACCGALQKLFPALLLNAAATTALNNAVKNKFSSSVRLAALLHDVALEEIKNIATRYRLPRDYAELAKLVAQWHGVYATASTLTADELLHLLKSVDALRRRDRFELFLQTCECCHPTAANNSALLIKAAAAVTSVDITPLQEKKLVGKDFADALQALQLKALTVI